MGDTLVWITGVSAGIGRALAAAVPWPEAKVIGISRRPVTSVELADHLEADLATQAGWSAVNESITTTLESTSEIVRVAFVHAAATVEPIGFAGEVDNDDYQAAVLLNTVAPQVLGRGFLDATEHVTCPRVLLMLATGRGSGVYPGWSAYQAGKAALDAWVLSEAAARDDDRLTLLSVAPGTVDTDMQSMVRHADERVFPRVEKFTELNDSGHLADAREVADRIWSLVKEPHRTDPLVDLRELPPLSDP